MTGEVKRPAVLAPRRLLWLVAGFSVWGSALIALYGLHALGCAYGWDTGGLLRGLLLGLLVLHLAVLGGMIVLLRRGLSRTSNAAAGQRDRVLEASYWCLWASLVATVFTFIPAAGLTTCV